MLGNTQGISTGPCGLLEWNFHFPSCKGSCSPDSSKCLEKPWLRMWAVSVASLCGYKNVSVELSWVLLLIFLWLMISLPVDQREAKSTDCRAIERLTD